MTLTPLLPLMYEPLVRTALLEDLGRAGDITADAIVPADKQSSLVLRARQPGVVAGLDIARCAFQLVNPAIRLTVERPDGSMVAPGDVIAAIEGPARGLLTGERTALNFLCHLGGVATATATLLRRPHFELALPAGMPTPVPTTAPIRLPPRTVR